MVNREWGNTGQNYLRSLLALGFQAFLIVVCVGYSASQAWRSLLVEQRLNQIKGSGDSRLVRWRICSL